MRIIRILKTFAFAVVLTPPVLVAQQPPAAGIRLTPDEMKWKPMPVPKGAENTTLIGSRTQKGPFVERVKFPPHFTHHPHFHPDDRTYTVILGTWYVGYGDTLDAAKLKAMPQGSFHTEPANVTHFIVTKDEGAVIQMTGTGPSTTTFVDASHDPQKKGN